jgi:hypothetical protein
VIALDDVPPPGFLAALLAHGPSRFPLPAPDRPLSLAPDVLPPPAASRVGLPAARLRAASVRLALSAGAALPAGAAVVEGGARIRNTARAGGDAHVAPHAAVLRPTRLWLRLLAGGGAGAAGAARLLGPLAAAEDARGLAEAAVLLALCARGNAAAGEALLRVGGHRQLATILRGKAPLLSGAVAAAALALLGVLEASSPPRRSLRSSPPRRSLRYPRGI